jgi:hypothetical protein
MIGGFARERQNSIMTMRADIRTAFYLLYKKNFFDETMKNLNIIDRRRNVGIESKRERETHTRRKISHLG